MTSLEALKERYHQLSVRLNALAAREAHAAVYGGEDAKGGLILEKMSILDELDSILKRLEELDT